MRRLGRPSVVGTIIVSIAFRKKTQEKIAGRNLMPHTVFTRPGLIVLDCSDISYIIASGGVLCTAAATSCNTVLLWD